MLIQVLSYEFCFLINVVFYLFAFMNIDAKSISSCIKNLRKKLLVILRNLELIVWATLVEEDCSEEKTEST